MLEAEREGFEPPEVLPSTVFKTAAIDHSAISPKQALHRIMPGCLSLTDAKVGSLFQLCKNKVEF